MNWVQDITRAVHDILEPEKNNLIIHIENMDTKRIYTPKHLVQLNNTYKTKYRDIKFSLILSSDNNALDFLKENREELFGNVPVVFSGINFFHDSDLDGYTNYTGITEEFDLLGTLRTALKLKPYTKEVFIINDYLKSGVAWKKAMQEQVKNFNKKLKITYSQNYTIEQLKQKLQSLSNKTIVVLGVFFKDKEGAYFTNEQIGEILSQNSPVPVFVLLEFNLNKGAVGGNIIGGYYQGKAMSMMAQQILLGTHISKLPVQRKGGVKSVFNYDELQKYKMDLSKLPKNSTIINQPKYKLSYSPEELEYLKKKKRITMCIDPDWMPFEKLDESGNHIGLSRDYFKIFEKNIGIPIEVIPTVSWNDSLLFAKQRKCDIVSLVMNTPKRSKYLSFTSPYVNLPLVLATKGDIAFIDNFKQLHSKKIGMVKGYAYNELIRDKYPEIEMVDVQNTKKGLSLVLDEKLYGFIGSVADIGYVFQKSFFGDIKIGGKFDEKWHLSVGVRNDDKLLLDIFEKNIQYLSPDRKQKILNKHLAIKYEKGVDNTMVWQVLLIAIAVFIAFWYRHRLLQKANLKLDVMVQNKTIELQELNENLEKTIQTRTHLLSLKAHRITYLLNNTSQGFLSFGTDFLIELEYSNECEKLLEKDLHDKNIAKLLFKKDKENSEFFKETMLDAYKESNDLTRTLILTLLPNVLIVNKRALRVEYKVLENNKFMLILTNITEKKKLESKIKKEQQVLKMIVSIASDTGLFYETKENYEEFCKEIKTHVNASKSALDNAQAVYILIHTFKGTFAQLYMQDTVKKLHEFESKLLKFIEKNIDDNEKCDKLLTQRNMIQFMDADLNTIVNTLGEAFLNEKYFYKINKNELNDLEEKISILIENSDDDNYSDLLLDVKQLKNKSLYEYLSAYPKLCERLCASSDKEIHNFDITGDLHILVSEKIKPFVNSLIHVFRNCCEHGIESKEDRNMRNKGILGRISCEIKQNHNVLFITIGDDGKGIDIESVKKKIIQNKLLEENALEKLSKKEILNYIFNVRFSTTQKLSEISGRGVGLSAVNSELDKLRGHVDVVSTENEGTQFIFKIPESV